MTGARLGSDADPGRPGREVATPSADEAFLDESVPLELYDDEILTRTVEPESPTPATPPAERGRRPSAAANRAYPGKLAITSAPRVVAPAITSGAPVSRSTAARVNDAFARLADFWPEFEPREPQREMAEHVASAFEHGGVLAVEAPTGVGKSIAYLLPAMLAAAQGYKRVVISTHTRNLQAQIVKRDAPRVRDVLAPGVRLALLKGRTNYLCVRRFEREAAQQDLIRGPRADFFDRLGDWASRTGTGDLDEFGGAATRDEREWLRAVAAPRERDDAALCHRMTRCFLRESRRRAAESQVVVVNHALLLTQHLTPAQILPEYELLIVDEAHTLPDVAKELLSRRVSPSELRAVLSQVTGGVDSGLLDQIGRLLAGAKGLSWTAAERAAAVARLTEAISRVNRVGSGFFRDLHRRMGRGERRYSRRDAEERAFGDVVDTLLDELNRLVADLGRIVATLASCTPPREEDEDALARFAGAVQSVADFRETLRFTIEVPATDYVYWYESDPEPALIAAPLRAGPLVAEHVLGAAEAAVMTSATLSSAGSFAHFLGEMGRSPNDVDTVLTETPFDTARQVLALAPDHPSPKEPGFVPETVRLVASLTRRLPHKALVLFTSNDQLRAVHAGLREALASTDVSVIGQGVDGSRDRITADFRRARRAVLLGTSSFWEGVDFPGEELELLVIARLPFPVPSHPVVEARCEAIDAEGGSSFSRFMIPEAVLRFRQGFGRLIRRRTDRGVFVILDSRIRTARYRGRFTESLPVTLYHTGDADETLAAAEDWLGSTDAPAHRP